MNRNLSIPKPQIDVEQILNSTVRMIRSTWKTKVCIYIHQDDQGLLKIRAWDGLSKAPPASFKIMPGNGILWKCMETNRLMESGQYPWEPELVGLLDSKANPHGMKYVVVPVSGQSKVLGAMIVGPFDKNFDTTITENDFRCSGALCAVLAAYVRLYDWTQNFVPQMNHELRTPLTAVQGSLGMLIGGMFGKMDGEVSSMLQMAHKGCERTVSAIETFLVKQQDKMPKP